MAGDLLTVVDDPHSGQPLLQPVMGNGRRLRPSPSLDEIRERTAKRLSAVPTTACTVEIAPRLRALAAAVDQEIATQDA